MRGDVGRHLQLAAPRAPPVARSQVAQLHLDPVDRGAPAGAVPVLPPGRRLPSEVRGVPVTGLLEHARLDQPVLRELADGLEERRTACACRAWSATTSDLRTNESSRRSTSTSSAPSTTAQMLVRSKPPANTDVWREQLALVVGQQVVRPLHGVAERELAFRPRLSSPATAGTGRRAGPGPRPRSWPPSVLLPARSRAGCRRGFGRSRSPRPRSPARRSRSRAGRLRARSTNSVTASEVTPPSSASGEHGEHHSPRRSRGSRATWRGA